MCSKRGSTAGPNFVEHFWQRLRALSRTVCLIAIVSVPYFFGSKLGPVPPGGPKNDTPDFVRASNLTLAFYCCLSAAKTIWAFALTPAAR
jgi:hypothetical protein